MSSSVDFEVQKFTRRCASTGRELEPGERFYSVLIPQGADVIRQDIAESEWDGPPENAIGFWQAVVPDPKANRLQLAPSDVMLQYFEALLDDADKKTTAYVLALLLIRRRIFKLEANQRDEDGRDVMLVYCQRNEKEYAIETITPSAEEAEHVQSELARMLYADAD